MAIIEVTKLQAAKRQLRTAIAMWFHDADPVCIHTLARTAYQIIHDMNVSRSLPELLFNSSVIRKTNPHIIQAIKNPSDYFKHGGVRKAKSITFNTDLTVAFFFFSMRGLDQLCVTLGKPEIAFIQWITAHRPDFVTQEGKEQIARIVPIDELESVRGMTKRDFYAQVVGRE